MPVLSYLAYPIKGAKNDLINDLAALDHCDVIPAKNDDLLILVTDTPDEEKERTLQQELKELKSLQSLAMTFGHTDDNAGDN